MRPVPPELRRRASPLAVLAAAATPGVAAALVAVVLVATGCQSAAPTRSAWTPTHGAGEPRQGGGDPAPATPAQATSAPASDAGPSAARGAPVLVVVGLPAWPRASIRDPDRPDAAGLPVALPVDCTTLAAVAVAADGRVAAVEQDGSTWVAPGISAGVEPSWTRLAGAVPPRAGPVLGATWTASGDAVVLVSGFPGSGNRLTTLTRLRLDGSPPHVVEARLEADGPGLAALPGGGVAFIGRDDRDRGVVARASPAGSVVTLPRKARTIASGGDLVALADDATVLVGTLADLERGRLPATPLPLIGGDGIGPIALAADGSGAAVVRLDAEGRALRIDVLRRVGPDLVPAVALGLEPADRTAIAAFLP